MYFQKLPIPSSTESTFAFAFPISGGAYHPPPPTHTRIHPLEFPLFLNLFGVPSGRNISVKKKVVALYSYAEDKKKTSFKKT